MNLKRLIGGVLFLWLSSAMAAIAEEDSEVVYDAGPYMEAGVGLIGQMLANYRGSTYYSTEFLPIPYFLYSGTIFKIDKGGVRGEFITSPRFELNVSVAGSLNGDADDNPLREGMPELDSSFEFGPAINVNLTGEDLREGWSLRMPFRGVFAFNSEGIDYVGYLLNPRLSWRMPEAFYDWRLSFNVGMVWADKRYNSYYYEVEPQYALPTRPAYKAQSGYGGSNLSVSLYRHVGTWRFGASLRYDYLGGAKFEDSPLVETLHSGSFSFGASKQLWSNR